MIQAEMTKGQQSGKAGYDHPESPTPKDLSAQLTNACANAMEAADA